MASQRPPAVPAPGRTPAARAGKRGLVPAPRHLHEDRRARGQRLTGGAPGQRRQPRRPRRRVPGLLEVRTRRLDPGRGGPDHRTRRDQGRGPADADHRLGLGRRRPPSDDQRRTLLTGAQHGDIPDVGVGRARLGVQVVPVVPHEDQAEVRDRCEHRRPGTHDNPGTSTADGEKAPVPFGRAGIGAQRDETARAERALQRGGDPVDVAVVGHDDQGPARGRHRGGHGRGNHRRPGRSGKRPPHDPGTAAGPQGGQRRLAVGVVRPGAGCQGAFRGPADPCAGPVRVAAVGTGGSRHRLLLHPGMPGWNGEPEHVGDRARVAVGHRPGQLGDLGGEDRFPGHDTVQEGEPAHMVGALTAFEDETVQEPAGEADPDACAGDGLPGPLLRHQIVERPVQMGMPDVHRDPGDRQLARRDRRPRADRPPPAGGCLGMRCSGRAGTPNGRRHAAARHRGGCTGRRGGHAGLWAGRGVQPAEDPKLFGHTCWYQPPTTDRPRPHGDTSPRGRDPQICANRTPVVTYSAGDRMGDRQPHTGASPRRRGPQIFAKRKFGGGGKFGGYPRTAAARACARELDSQVKSSSGRPKWP